MTDKIAQFRGTIYEDGYGLIAKKIMKDTNITLGAKALYSYICSYAGTSGKAFPGRDLILHELGISKDTFSKYKNELVEHGYLAITQEKDNGKFKHNVYEITNSPCPKISDTIKPDTEISDTTNSDIINNSLKNNNNTINNIYNDVEEVEQNKDKYLKEDKIPYKDIIDYLNEKAGTKYKHTSKATKDKIKTRCNEEYTLDDFKSVIDKKCTEWLGTDMQKFLRPETLFGTKFEGYLNQCVKIKPKDIQIHKNNTFDFGGM